MTYSSAKAELDDLLDQLMADEPDSFEYIVEQAMFTAIARCNVKASKRNHAMRLMREFWKEVSGGRAAEPQSAAQEKDHG